MHNRFCIDTTKGAHTATNRAFRVGLTDTNFAMVFANSHIFRGMYAKKKNVDRGVLPNRMLRSTFQSTTMAL